METAGYVPSDTCRSQEGYIYITCSVCYTSCLQIFELIGCILGRCQQQRTDLPSVIIRYAEVRCSGVQFEI